MLYEEATKQIKEYLNFLFPSYPTWSYKLLEYKDQKSWRVIFTNTDPQVSFDVNVQGGPGNAKVLLDFEEMLYLDHRKTNNLATMLIVISAIMSTLENIKDVP